MKQAFKNLDISGIQDYLILLDIDGTIATDNEVDLDEAVLRKIGELGQQNKVYLCSNSRNHERNREVARRCGLEYIDTDLRKPDVAILDLIDHSPFNGRLVIGDKFMTDGRFAKNIHAEFIRVERIASKNDKPHIKFLYWFDDIVSKFTKL